jgi:hypothetical protein
MPKPYVHVRHSRNLLTVFDAVQEMRKWRPDLPPERQGELKVSPIRLPGFIESRLVGLFAPPDEQGDAWLIGMPSSRRFTARRAITGGVKETYNTDQLNGAICDQDGNVSILDSEHTMCFYDVSLMPEPLQAELTAGQARALRLTLEFISLTYSGQPRPIRYELLPMMKPPPLKVIKGRIDDRRRADPSIPEVSTEIIRSALSVVGMRAPRFRRATAEH